VVAAEPISDIDSTGAEMLVLLLDDLDSRGIEFAFAELKGPVKDRLRSYGLYDRIGDEFFYSTIGVAVATYSHETGLPSRGYGDADQDR
jgi:anti-anti-sigma regulatory factor